MSASCDSQSAIKIDEYLILNTCIEDMSYTSPFLKKI